MRSIIASRTLGRRGVLSGAAATIVLNACRSNDGEATPARDIRPEEPVDESFRGCQLSASCGASAAPEGIALVLQPSARVGDLTRCPVSGAVFQVADQRPRREYRGHDLFFCCAACARYFDEHAEAVARLRRF